MLYDVIVIRRPTALCRAYILSEPRRLEANNSDQLLDAIKREMGWFDPAQHDVLVYDVPEMPGRRE